MEAKAWVLPALHKHIHTIPAYELLLVAHKLLINVPYNVTCMLLPLCDYLLINVP